MQRIDASSASSVLMSNLFADVPHALGPDDEGTINVASKKVVKNKTNGVIKLKQPPPKQMKPGNWRDGSVLEGPLRLLDYNLHLTAYTQTGY